MRHRSTTRGRNDDLPILVTGGAGYIGSAVVRQLLEQGRRVRILDALLYGDEPIRDVLEHPHVELIVGDFRHEPTVASVLEDVSAIIHLGAIVGDPACALDQDLAISSNVDGSVLLAELGRQRGVGRLVFASTCSVYGASHEPLDESSELHPVSLYANTKITAERKLLELGTPDFSPVVLRFGTAYGMSARFRFDLVVNLLTAKAVQEGQITLHGGDQWRPFIHVLDIARAVLLVLDAPRDAVAGQVINVGVDEQNYQLRQVGDIIQELVPSSEVMVNTEITDRRNYYVRFAKARALLGFQPSRTVEDGVRELVDALRLGQVADYRDAVYHNVVALSQRPPQEIRSHLHALRGSAD